MTTSEIRHDNGTIIDLKKVAYARYFYREVRTKIERTIKPTKHSVNGQMFEDTDLAMTHNNYPNETMLSRAKRMCILDVWMPVWKAIMCNGHEIEFTWRKAHEMDKAWRAYIFNKKKGKQ